MPSPNGTLSFRGDLKHSYYCDMEAIQIAAKVQQAYGAQEIANLAQQTKLEDMEIPTKKARIIALPSKTDTIEINLVLVIPPRQLSSVPTSLKNRNSRSPTFSEKIRISLRGSPLICQVFRESWLSINWI
jgi:hypothetical protein